MVQGENGTPGPAGLSQGTRGHRCHSEEGPIRGGGQNAVSQAEQPAACPDPAPPGREAGPGPLPRAASPRHSPRGLEPARPRAAPAPRVWRAAVLGYPAGARWAGAGGRRGRLEGVSVPRPPCRGRGRRAGGGPLRVCVARARRPYVLAIFLLSALPRSTSAWTLAGQSSRLPLGSPGWAPPCALTCPEQSAWPPVPSPFRGRRRPRAVQAGSGGRGG